MRKLLLAGLLIGICSTAQAAITVYFSTATTQQDFIAGLEDRYVLSVSTPMFFPNDRKVIVLGVKDYTPPPPPIPPEIITLNTIAEKLVEISSDTYVYGFAAGMEYERKLNLDLVGSYVVNCSSPSFFNYTSTQTVWQPLTCYSSLGKVWSSLFDLLK